MKLWLLLIGMVVGMALIVLTLIEFAELYGGDWEYISSTIAGAILTITVMAVIIVVIKRER